MADVPSLHSQDDFGDLIANEEAEAAQEEGSHLRSAYQRASRHAWKLLFYPVAAVILPGGSTCRTMRT